MTIVPLNQAVFTLSLDFELIWGTRDWAGTERFREACEVEREVVIDRLLALLERHEISAAWCTVGHLFLDRCEKENGRKHPDVLRPQVEGETGDWFDDDPCTNERDAPTFYGRALMDRIRNCAVPQEIGSHSFSHVIFTDPTCSREVAASEIAKCAEIAAEQGLTLRSFVYPRNEIAHLDVLEQYGFTSFRGRDPVWYDRHWVPKPLRRIAHFGSVAVAATPPVVLPERVGRMWNIAGSMILLPMHGFRKYIPASRRVARAAKGLEKAVAERKIFHLWFHPTNLAIEVESMFGALEKILLRVSALREAGKLEVLTMGEIASRASALRGALQE